MDQRDFLFEISAIPAALRGWIFKELHHLPSLVSQKLEKRGKQHWLKAKTRFRPIIWQTQILICEQIEMLSLITHWSLIALMLWAELLRNPRAGLFVDQTAIAEAFTFTFGNSASTHVMQNMHQIISTAVCRGWDRVFVFLFFTGNCRYMFSLTYNLITCSATQHINVCSALSAPTLPGPHHVGNESA